MINIKQTHRDAMAQTDLAFQARANGEKSVALHHFKLAFELEAAAANALINNFSAEPSRSVLFRSAATLARDCGQFADAEKLIYKALAGDPPGAIEEELRDLLAQVTFERHLELRGIRLADDEIQVAITGKSVGFGMASVDVFVPRIEGIENLLVRTAERMRNQPYRERGRRSKEVVESTELSISAPRAACFAVSFRVGGAIQPSLPGLSPSEEVIDEFLDCLKLYTEHEDERLKERITDEAYYRNFVGLAERVQPDGDRVDMVGFTAVRGGETKSVAMRRLSEKGSVRNKTTTTAHTKQSENTENLVTVRGHLLIANAKRKSEIQSGVVDIVTRDNVSVRISVPPGMMSDIVRPLWERNVEVIGVRVGKRIQLTHIREIYEQ